MCLHYYYTIQGGEIETQVALQNDRVSGGGTEAGGEDGEHVEEDGDQSELVVLDPAHVSSTLVD